MVEYGYILSKNFRSDIEQQVLLGLFKRLAGFNRFLTCMYSNNIPDSQIQLLAGKCQVSLHKKDSYIF